MDNFLIQNMANSLQLFCVRFILNSTIKKYTSWVRDWIKTILIDSLDYFKLNIKSTIYVYENDYVIYSYNFYNFCQIKIIIV